MVAIEFTTGKTMPPPRAVLLGTKGASRISGLRNVIRLKKRIRHHSFSTREVSLPLLVIILLPLDEGTMTFIALYIPERTMA